MNQKLTEYFHDDLEYERAIKFDSQEQDFVEPVKSTSGKSGSVSDIIKSQEEKMEETQESLENIGIGTKETAQLKPAIVKIVKASVVSVSEKAKKVSCEVSHPDKAEGTIQISSAKVEQKNNLKFTGLWFNRDEDGLIPKSSALALFLRSLNVQTVKELEGKEVETIEDDKGYLAFKGY